MSVVTRFAPSPTGDLHIGGARTALFNWLFARHHGGKFLMRVEDTDRVRSTPEATQAIYDGMNWLGLDWDEEPVHQATRADRHAEVARDMLATGKAYKCFSTQEEIQTFRETAKANKTSSLFLSPWRDADPASHPDAPFVVRVKAPRTGKIAITDQVQGDVAWDASTLDDLVLLRSDGTPTYMLAVVVDDHDMGVTHVIRGDDHLTNTARQAVIYDALDWERPTFAHIPLIYGPDGKKMSKRHGATSVSEYAEMGYPAYAMRNYLSRLGWSHGDDEFFSTEQAIEWFDLKGVGKSPAQFDFKKLGNLSGQHIRERDDAAILADYLDFAALQQKNPPPADKMDLLKSAIPVVKQRAKTLQDIETLIYFAITDRPLELDEKSANALDSVSRGILNQLTSRLQNVSWTSENLESEIKAFAEESDLKFGAVAQPIRAALTGRANSPGITDVLMILGREESLARLADQTS